MSGKFSVISLSSSKTITKLISNSIFNPFLKTNIISYVFLFIEAYRFWNWLCSEWDTWTSVDISCRSVSEYREARLLRRFECFVSRSLFFFQFKDKLSCFFLDIVKFGPYNLASIPQRNHRSLRGPAEVRLTLLACYIRWQSALFYKNKLKHENFN